MHAANGALNMTDTAVNTAVPEDGKICLIAGGGSLPKAVVQAAIEQGRDIYIAGLAGFFQPEDYEGCVLDSYRLGEFGRLIKTLKSKDIKAVTFAGTVKRPDFKAVRPDMGGMKYLPGILKAATKGDDALLTHITKIFDKEGISLVGAQDICSGLVVQQGVLTQTQPNAAHMRDIDKARHIAKSIGALDIGQGAVVRDGLVLAVEAQDGTDGMLRHVGLLPDDIRGKKEATDSSSSSGSSVNRGVLAKMVKPGQELRIDLPTIGLTTIKAAIESGLDGIAVEEGGAFILDREAAITEADKAGLFIIGLERVAFEAGPYKGNMDEA